MRLRFTINDEFKELDVNSNEPLSFTLRSFDENITEYIACKNYNCGHCVVQNRATDEIILSCLTPAFKIQGADIITPDYFYTNKQSSYIRSSYRELGIFPCEECKKERTLLFHQIVSSLLKKIVNTRAQKDSFFFIHNEDEFDNSLNSSLSLVSQNKDYILSYMSTLKCYCLRSNDILKITEVALDKRRKANV